LPHLLNDTNIFDLFSLKGKVAVVTGAGSGLGVAFSVAMAEAGADVVCADIRKEGAAETISKIEGLGQKGLSVGCDVTREEDVENMVKKGVERFGKIDILINSAGISDAPHPAHELPVEEWDKVVAVNLRGIFLVAKEVLKVMVKQKEGKVVNVGSVWGQVGSSTIIALPAYTATKGAIINFTRELALEYAPLGIHVNCLAPGFFRSELGGGAYHNPEFVKMATKTIPMGSIGEAEDLKGSILYLASKASDFVTGHVLVIDGGYLAK